MKIPPPPAASVRVFLAILALFAFASPPRVRADLVLQLPIARASHSFSLWEYVPGSPSEGMGVSEGWPALGILPGGYRIHPVLPIGVVGGVFDSEGVWQPGGNPFLSGFLSGDFTSSTFFILDDATGEGVQANRADLVASVWFPLTSNSVPTMFFAIPSGGEGNPIRENNVFAFYDGGNSWYPVSKGEVQRWVEDGESRSLGYFEAWAFIPTTPGSWALFDITDNQISWGSATAWESAGGWSPTVQVRIRVPYAGETFTLYATGGATQQATSEYAVWNENEFAYVVTASIGIDQEFHAVRDSDGRPGFFHTAYLGGSNVDETALFTEYGPITNWQPLSFQASSPWGMKVRRLADGVETALTVDTGDLGQYINDPTGTQSVWVSRYGCSAYVDIAGGWTVVDAGNAVLGLGPEFIDWPVFGSVQTSAMLSHSREGHTLRTNFGDLLAPTGQSGSWWITGSGGGYSMSWDGYTVPIPAAYSGSGGYVSISDETAGETSPAVWMDGNSDVLLPEWHATSQVILKISATRWGNDLRIRCANGSSQAIGRHQVQGDWSWSASGGWFNSYGFFDAEGTIVAGIPWELYDATRGESLSAALGGWGVTDFSLLADNTDTDGDTLPDWYERTIGTNPFAQNTDGDTQGDDAYELAHGTNPRAAAVTASSNTTLSVFTLLEK